MREEQEEKVSSRRLEKDLYTVERNFLTHEKYWESVTLRSRTYLIFLVASHAVTLHHLCSGFYRHNIDISYILPALVTSALLAWFGHSGRCGHLNGLNEYRATRSRALARLSLDFRGQQMVRKSDWSATVAKCLEENHKIIAMTMAARRSVSRSFDVA
jgi:hypothetical protein